MPAKGKKASKKQIVKFSIDCSQPIEDKVIDPSSFEKYLYDRIKVDGKTGNLGDAVKISRDKSKLVVAAELPFSKRYLKYLTKKYLKKKQLRDYLRVVATSKSEYKLSYYSFNEAEAEEEDS